MIPIIRKREQVSQVSYSLSFETSPGCGFGFPCDKDGNIDRDNLNPAALENLRKCETREYKVSNPQIKQYINRYIDPALAKCICGHTIELAAFTNTCERCNRDYNMSGQELAPRSQWGEETGETPSEILNIGQHIS